MVARYRLSPGNIVVSAFSEGHGVSRVEVHFRLDVDIGKDRDERARLELAVERAIAGLVIGKG